MKTRWSAVLVLIGIVLSLSGLMAGQNIVTPPTALATTTGCTSSTDYFGCQLSGSTTGAGWRVQNNDTSSASRAVAAQVLSPSGIALNGYASATSGNSIGVRGESTSSGGYGVFGYASATSGNTIGVRAESSSSGGYGVYANASATSGPTYGVDGWTHSPNGIGVHGQGGANSGNSFGIYGGTFSPTGYAGYFYGQVQVNGNFSVANGYKNFVIDHPLDPANKYLYHAAIESSEMKNVYDGVVTLNAKGEAWVDLPKWFQAINKNFRYQLTAINAPGPNLYVGQEIQNNRFKIAGGTQGMKVSWQVTGIRNDPYAAEHPLQVEVDKPNYDRGTYLYPKGYNQPETKGRDYAMYQQMHSAQPAEPPSH